MKHLLLVALFLATLILPVAVSAADDQAVFRTAQGDILAGKSAENYVRDVLFENGEGSVERKLLSSIFGAKVINKVSGGAKLGDASSTPMTLFLGLELLFLVFLMLMIFANLVHAVISISHSGSVQNHSNPLAILTLAIVPLMILPTRMTDGIPPATLFVAHIAMWGSNAGTLTAKTGVGLIGVGEGSYAPSADIDVSQVRSLAAMLICAGQAQAPRQRGDKLTERPLMVFHYKDSAGNKRKLSSYRSLFHPAPAGIAIEGLTRIEFGARGQCGTVQLDFDLIAKALQKDDGYVALTQRDAYSAYKFVLIETINELSPVVAVFAHGRPRSHYVRYSSYVNDLLAADDAAGLTGIYEGIYQANAAFAKTAKQYPDRVKARIELALKTGESTKKFGREVVDETSWVVLPKFLLSLLSKTGANLEIYSAVNSAIGDVPEAVCNDGFVSGFWGDPRSCGGDDFVTNDIYYADLMFTDFRRKVYGAAESSPAIDRYFESEGCDGENCENESALVKKIEAGFSNTVLDFVSKAGNTLNGESFKSSSADISGLSSPFEFIMGLGHSSKYLAATTWSIGLAAASFGGVTKNIIGKLTVGDMLSDSIKYLTDTIVKPATMMFMAAGVMLAYGPILIITTVWIIAVIGWLTVLVEAIIAAPIALIMLCAPAGLNLSGNTFLRIVALVFRLLFEPTLRVIGFFFMLVIGSMIFMVINYVFWAGGAPLLGDGLIVSVVTLIAYTVVIYKALTKVLEIPVSLPDRISEWLSGGMARPFGEMAGAGEADATARSIDSKSMAMLPKSKSAK